MTKVAAFEVEAPAETESRSPAEPDLPDLEELSLEHVVLEKSTPAPKPEALKDQPAPDEFDLCPPPAADAPVEVPSPAEQADYPPREEPPIPATAKPAYWSAPEHRWLLEAHRATLNMLELLGQDSRGLLWLSPLRPDSLRR